MTVELEKKISKLELRLIKLEIKFNESNEETSKLFDRLEKALDELKNLRLRHNKGMIV